MRNVAITNSPSGYSSIGPMSTSSWPWPTNAGMIAKPATGAATMPVITPPSPRVASERNVLRE